MPSRLREVAVPDFGEPLARPAISPGAYARRCDLLFAGAGCDWVIVYADREHSANIAFLSGFEPRFEEALLLLGKGGVRIFVTGNECRSYTAIAGLPGFTTALSQSMSLLGQDRSQAPSAERVLRECGVSAGQTIGLVGWKYLEPSEWDGAEPAFFIPSFLVQVVARIAGAGGLKDCTKLLMHPTTGLRCVVDADEIAMLEWGAARASAAVWRIVQGIQVGDTEIEAAARMNYAGEPLSCHMMLTSNDRSGPVLGLSSPTARCLREGDGVATAVGYWGGLSCRAGLLVETAEGFLAKANGYFDGLCAWYETADIGVSGGQIYRAVSSALATHGLRSALNPGHLVSLDEWSNTPIRSDSPDLLASGMAFQVDIIPTPMANGEALNCEDAIAVADADLRAEIESRHPSVYKRIRERRAFVRDEIGIELKPCILPLSSTPLCLPPFWLSPRKLLTRT